MRTYELAVAFLVQAGLCAQGAVPLDWTLDGNPPSRSSFAMVFHAGIGETVLFGGYQGAESNDTWLWRDGWRRVDTASSPPRREDPSMAYDSLRQRIVLFGGSIQPGSNPTPLDDMWAFDGADWTQLTPAISPSGRYGSRMAHDPARDRMVLYGGRVTNGPTAELWEFDGATWSMPIPQGTLPTYEYGDLVYDPAHAEIVLAQYNGVFAWDGTHWATRSMQGLPAGFEGGAMFFEESGQRLLQVNPLVNGHHAPEIYASAGQEWTVVSWAPLVTQNQVVMARAGSDRILGFHTGLTSFASPASDTWLLDAGQWQRIQQSAPAGRSNAAMVFDSHRQQLVLHGGQQNGRLTDTVELQGQNWHLASAGNSLVARTEHCMVYDTSRDVVVVVGGEDQYSRSVLEWNGTAWSYYNPPVSPAGRWKASAVYDSARSRTVLFGGLGQPFVGTLWAWDGTAWTDISPASSPSSRYDAGMSYDVVRDRIVMFGGTNTTVRFDDTWEFDGVQWAQATPGTSPVARSGHVQVYDSDRNVTVLFGGTDGTPLLDTWQWDGLDWTLLPTLHRPDSGVGVCGAYDPSRRAIVLFGGEGNRGEVWRLRDPSLGVWQGSGQGCDSGYGPLMLTSSDALVIGRTAAFEVANLPNHLAVLAAAWVGFDNQAWNGQPLPVSLSQIGRPDCMVWAEPSVPIWLSNSGTGVGAGVLAVPGDSAFLGLQVYLQAVTWEPGQNRFATANLLAARIGA
jgi:hypothetical protein